MKLEEMEGIVEFVDDSDDIKIVQKVPGEDANVLEPGLWECMRCEHRFRSEKAPRICANPDCARRGPFKVIVPPVPKRIPWHLPGAPAACDHTDLLRQIANFIEEHVELPDGRLYEVLASWVMATWIWETVSDTCPYLFFLGPKESGKTRALEVLNAVSYRAIRSGSFSPAAMVRRMDHDHCTVLLDEVERQLNVKTEAGSILYAILNTGYKKGDYYERCVGDSQEPVGFETYGFKALAATRGFLPTLESRCIVVSMERAEKRMPNKIDAERARELRSMLLHFRLEELEKISPIEWGGDVGVRISGRLIEMFTPLVTIAHFFHDTISPWVELLKDVQASRVREEQESFEFDVVSAIAGAVDDAVYLNDISTHVTDSSPQRIGYCLKKLGIVKRKDRSGRYVSKSENSTRLQKLQKRYQI